VSGGPFRWDLVTPSQLGTLLDGVPTPAVGDPELARCSGKVLARSANGDLAFVGRSLDSMFDLLSGALSGVEAAPVLDRVPISFAREWQGRTRRALTVEELQVARDLLASAGVTPYALARRTRPVTFVDVAHTGGTFGELYGLIRDWVEDERAQWDVIRRKIRFVGITSRTKTSPNTERWAQLQPWTSELPSRSVMSVSMEPRLWSYFGDHQPKLTRSFTPERWVVEADGPDRSERTRAALAEAVALVAHGRGETCRRQVANAMKGERALAEPWLRDLRTRLLRA
jgi:hypothetical protein